MWFSEHGDDVLDEIEEFLTGSSPRADPDRRCSRCCSPTSSGPPPWPRSWGHALAGCSISTTRSFGAELARFGGREIDVTGDGFLATFDAPAARIRCAHAVGDTLAATGVSIRAGVHTGEVEVMNGDVRGRTR